MPNLSDTRRSFFYLSLVLGMALVALPGKAAEPSSRGTSLSLVTLGSGGPGASGRAASSYLVLLDETPRILVDAGPGSFVRLGESQLSLEQTALVLLTHLHADHVAELPGLFKARAVAGSPSDFEIWGPAGAHGGGGQAYFPSTSTFIDQLFGPRGAFAYLPEFAAPMHFRVHDVIAPAMLVPRRNAAPAGLLLRAAPGHHGDAPAVVYRVEYAGRSITFSGDIDAHGLPALRALAKDTDLLVFDCVVLDRPASPAILYELHTPPKAIGELAAAAGAKQLLLSHLSPATDHGRASVEAGIREQYRGPVSFAADLQRIDLH